MTQNERIKKIRLKSNLTMEQFGERIGVSKSTISNIENGNRNATAHMIKSICREFHADYFWLTEGTGEMFLDTGNELLEDLADEYNLDETDVKIIEKFLSMPAEDRANLKKYITNLFT